MSSAAPIPARSAEVERDVDDDASFLAEVRAFLDARLTPELREAGRRTTGVHSEIGACRTWHRRLHERGWIAPAWPRAWGGAGWTPRQRYLFERECALNDAPVLFAGGIRSLGPLLIEAGAPEQRARYLPAILSGRDLWAQGFSEPQAGSDLAAIRTRAQRRGDHYVINGSKIWTTGAHHCNRMFALVRTADGARKQDGITFLLIDMPSDGLTVSPIRDLVGAHEFNAVFFEDVRVPVSQRVGAEGDGWAVAKRLMQLARSNNTPSAVVRRSLQQARALLSACNGADDVHRRRLALCEMQLEAYAQLELAALPSGRPRPGDDSAPSMLKLMGTELNQQVSELALDIAGYSAAARDALGAAAHEMAKYLSLRAATIYSGTSETHRNILARLQGL